MCKCDCGNNVREEPPKENSCPSHFWVCSSVYMTQKLLCAIFNTKTKKTKQNKIKPNKTKNKTGRHGNEAKPKVNWHSVSSTCMQAPSQNLWYSRIDIQTCDLRYMLYCSHHSLMSNANDNNNNNNNINKYNNNNNNNNNKTTTLTTAGLS